MTGRALLESVRAGQNPAQLLTEAVLNEAGPFIGPKGGKWADKDHTIPWKDTSKPEVSGTFHTAKAARDAMSLAKRKHADAQLHDEMSRAQESPHGITAGHATSGIHVPYDKSRHDRADATPAGHTLVPLHLDPDRQYDPSPAEQWRRGRRDVPGDASHTYATHKTVHKALETAGAKVNHETGEFDINGIKGRVVRKIGGGSWSARDDGAHALVPKEHAKAFARALHGK